MHLIVSLIILVSFSNRIIRWYYFKYVQWTRDINYSKQFLEYKC